MSEKQTKRKRREERKRRAVPIDSGGQTTLWETASQEQLTAGASGTVLPEGDTPAHVSTARQNNPADFGPLAIALSAAVPLQVWEFYRQQGPTVIEIEEGRAFGRTLAERGDRLLYRGSKRGETGEIFADLARALAAVSFVVPGGFPNLFAERYDALEILGGWIGEAAAREYCQEITERYYAELPRVSATFTMSDSETEAETLTCDVTPWFDLASDAEILSLRAEGYRSPKSGEGGMAAHIVAWAADRNAPLAALCQRASTAGRAIICRVDVVQAHYYCHVHRRKLLARTAERAEGEA